MIKAVKRKVSLCSCIYYKPAPLISSGGGLVTQGLGGSNPGEVYGVYVN